MHSILQSLPPYPDLHPPLVGFIATFDAEQLIIFTPEQVVHVFELDVSLK